jgi:hypothetical protein
MAANLIPNESRVRVSLQVGTDALGEPIYKSKTFSRMKPAATNDAVYTVIDALMDLQAHPVNDMQRIDYGQLEEAI